MGFDAVCTSITASTYSQNAVTNEALCKTLSASAESQYQPMPTSMNNVGHGSSRQLQRISPEIALHRLTSPCSTRNERFLAIG